MVSTCSRSSLVVRFAIVAGMLVATETGRAADAVLPGTKLLTITQPLDEVMVAGIDKFALREIAASPARRDQLWKLDGIKVEDWDKTLAPRRAKFAEIIGAVDPRVTSTESHRHVIERIGDNVERMAFVGGAEGISITAVRWNVLAGVTAEGLLVNRTISNGKGGFIIAVPDADITPEMFCGLAPGVAPQAQLPVRLAEEGFTVLVPMLISRSDEHSGSPHVRYTNQTHREFIYRQAFEMGRHVIGYEVQKVLAAVDLFAQTRDRLKTKVEEQKVSRADFSIGVVGVGEGGLIALYSAALDPRIDSTLVSGYFRQREGVWSEPIYRNVWGLLTEFGDAELAGMIAPRALTIEASGVTEIAGPPAARQGRGGAAPGKIETATLASVRVEHDRAKRFFDALKASDKLTLSASGEGDAPAGTPRALTAFVKALGVESDFSKSVPVIKPVAAYFPEVSPANEPKAREKRQLDELQVHVQTLMRLSHKVRDAKWNKLDRSTPEKWAAGVEPLRDWVYDSMIGRLPNSTMPLNPRTRLVAETAPWLKGHEGAFDTFEVVLDVYDDVIASGTLLIPKDLKPGEKRPVVVCQHGLEGVPQDTISGPGSEGHKYYKAFAAELCKRGFITYAPQNPYRGRDLFRTLQRKSNVMQRSLYSYIIPQHDRTLEWLASLPFVDQDRLAFYGLSYGGKTAVRVPPFLPTSAGKPGYCLSICSADYDEWVMKIVSNEEPYSYVFTGEYEISEWNMGHVANYAELSNLMTPRPFMVERGHDDGVAPDEWVAWEFAKVFRHYDKMGLGDKAEIEFFNGPHTINGQATYRFLHRHLNWAEKK